TTEQRDPEWSELAARVAAGDDRILIHDLPRGSLVRRLEDGDAGVHVAERRTHEDDDAVVEEAFEPLEMDPPDGGLLGGHRAGEVLARRVDEVDPVGHRVRVPLVGRACRRRYPSRVSSRGARSVGCSGLRRAVTSLAIGAVVLAGCQSAPTLPPVPTLDPMAVCQGDVEVANRSVGNV